MPNNIELKDSHENLDIATSANANIFEALGNAFFEIDTDMENEDVNYNQTKQEVEAPTPVNEASNIGSGFASKNQRKRKSHVEDTTANSNEGHVPVPIIDSLVLVNQEPQLRSPTWNHFILIMVREKKMGKCKYCKTLVPVDNRKNGTSRLLNHVNYCKLHLENKPKQNLKQSMIKFKTVDDDHGNEVILMTNWKFDAVAVRKALAMWVIMDELPFCIVEKAGFRKFC
ncbi:hypothetical protein SLEP1_g9664 [Rubroshorea leprosula]|uniref:BED-type domain-containing protein n=1 Tax=Rubroshorea leprosula TaxID=152421 RepID=A0AAV5I5L4_9ROSI|nr:hypothetical protein SLEP1_g9664 [Rubroshorea leprosula]